MSSSSTPGTVPVVARIRHEPTDESRLRQPDLRLRSLLVDTALAIVAVAILSALSDRPEVAQATQVGLVMVTAVPLAVRRLWPIPAFTVSAVAAIASIPAGVNSGEGLVVSALALYTLARRIQVRRSQRALPIVVALGLGVLFAVGVGPKPGLAVDVDRVLIGVVSLGAAWSAGRYAAQRQWHAMEAAQRAACAAVVEERLRISREIHDVVGHSMSLITVQAAVARHVAPRRPEEALAALARIEDTSRKAMSEIRSLLSVLRPETAEERRSRHIADIPSLIEEATTAGLDIQVSIDEVDGLTEGLESAVFRIVQQALTNVVDHAPGAAVQVEIHQSEDRLEVVVQNTAASRPVEPGGSGGLGIGLVGMQERAAIHGGQIEAGPIGDGYRVQASFPLDRERQK